MRRKSLEEIRVHVRGHSAPQGTPFAVHTQILGIRRPSQTTTAGLLPKPLSYYDVSIEGISDGMATIMIANDAGLPERIQYWDGARWVDLREVSHSGNTVSGDIAVGLLRGTPPKKIPIVIGT